MVFFFFYSNFNSTSCKQTEETLIRPITFAESDMGLHCLPISSRKVTCNRLMLVKCSMLITLEIRLEPDEARQIVGPGLHPNFLHNYG